MKLLKVSYPAYQMNSFDRLLNNLMLSERCFDRYGRDELNRRPATNVYENEQSVEIALSVPGYKKDQLQIEVDNDILAIRGNVANQEESGSKHVYVEFKTANFEKKFRLSDKLDAEKVNARFENGILTVTVPRKELVSQKKREVEIV